MTQDRRKRAAPLAFTPSALSALQGLAAKRMKEGGTCNGIRIGVRTRGCNGHAYTMEYAKEQHPLDEVIDLEDVRVLVDPKAILFLLGMTVDYVEDPLHSGFVFNNPNEKGRCGCGESFHV